MSVVAELVAKLSVDGVSEAGRDLGGFSSKLEDLSGKARGWGAALSVGVTAPLVLFGNQAAETASSVSESMNKVAVVFGDSGDSVIEFSKTTASAMGISQAAALETAGTFGNIFNASGLAQDAAADMSQNLVQLAADLASFNNEEPTVVLDKLRAGLVGEAEPLRALGVLLSEDAVKTKALAMGLADTAKELTAADKVQARYALIMEQTAVAQGDFARTAEGAANSARIATAQYQDMQTVIGQQVLPIKMKLLGVVGQLIGVFANLSPAQQELIVKIGMLAAAVGPLLAGLGMIAPALGVIGAALGVLLSPIGLVVAAIAALGVAWATNFGGIQDKTKIAVDYISGVIQTALTAIKGWWDAHGAQVMAVVSFVWDQVMVYFRGAFEAISAVFAAFRSAFSGDWYGFGQNLRRAWDAVWNTMVTLFKNIVPILVRAAVNLATSIVEAFRKIDWGELGRMIVNGIVNTLKSMGGLIINTILGIVGSAIDAVKGFFGGGKDESGAGASPAGGSLAPFGPAFGGGLALPGMGAGADYVQMGMDSGRAWAQGYRDAVHEGVNGLGEMLAASLQPAVDYRYRRQVVGVRALP